MKETLGACGLAWCLAVPLPAVGQAVRLGEVPGNSPRYLSVANSASLRPANITLECWVRALGPGYDEPGVGSLLIGRPAQGVGGDDLVSWGLYYSSITGAVSFEMAGSVFGTNGQSLTSVGTFPVGTAAHVAVTYDGATIKLYLNGALNNQATIQSEMGQFAEALASIAEAIDHYHQLAQASCADGYETPLNWVPNAVFWSDRTAVVTNRRSRQANSSCA